MKHSQKMIIASMKRQAFLRLVELDRNDRNGWHTCQEIRDAYLYTTSISYAETMKPLIDAGELRVKGKKFQVTPSGRRMAKEFIGIVGALLAAAKKEAKS